MIPTREADPAHRPSDRSRARRQAGQQQHAFAGLHHLQRTIGNAALGRLLQRDDVAAKKPVPKAAPIDATAQAIVAAAQDTTKPIAERAKKTVKSIIDTYFASDAALVKEIVYDEAQKKGLSTDVATSKTATGKIFVSKQFVEDTTDRHFARRVLQVEHELEHVRQHRRGMGGPKTKNEREFLAFLRESLATELPGTGKMQHGTRVNLIDGALGNYYCLSKDKQDEYKDDKEKLLKAREEHVTKSHSEFPAPPTACKPSD